MSGTRKKARFLGSAQDDLRAFPVAARKMAGFELQAVERGDTPSDFKPMSSVGVGVCEIRVRTEGQAHRVLYVAKFPEAVYVLHCFEKKTRKTSRKDIETGKRRYAELLKLRSR